MASFRLPDHLVDTFAADRFQPRLRISRLQRDDALIAEIERAAAAIPEEVVEEVLTNPFVKVWLAIKEATPNSLEARMQVFLHLLEREIYERRSNALQDESQRPQPYNHSALTDLEVDDEKLLPLSAFDVGMGHSLIRRGFVFSPTPPLPGTNSHTESSRVLFALAKQQPRLRIDPLLVQPVAAFTPQMFRMFAYGRPLDWDRIATLRGEEFVRWLPDELTSFIETAFTDLVWSRRDDSVHFECEEVPRHATTRAARYFHAIYDVGRQALVHADFALRFYTDAELLLRNDEHLRKLSKVGRRIKLFRVDGEVKPEVWSGLVAGAFVGNNDVQRYFLGERAFEDEYSPLLPEL